MSSFVGKINKENNLDIPRSEFWPGFNSDEIRDEMRILNFVSNDQLVKSVKEALIFVINQLSNYESFKKSEGYEKLESVPFTEIAGENRNILLFKQAVFSKTKSLLLKNYRDMDLTRKPGEDQANREEPSIRELEASTFISIRTLQGLSDVYAVLL